MKPTWEKRMMRLYRIGEHPVTVTGTTEYTDYYRRVHFHAPAAVAELDDFPTLWFRLWVDHPTEEGKTQRAYTFIDLDRGSGTFSADFVLHAPTGPGGDFGAVARPGDATEMSLTPARVKVPEGTRRLIVAGDLSALPAINSWLESAPEKVTVEAFIADDHADHAALPLATRPGATVTWTGTDPGALASAVTARASGGAATFAWGAGERDLVKELRGAFTGLGLGKRDQFSQMYWIRGKAHS